MASNKWLTDATESGEDYMTLDRWHLDGLRALITGGTKGIGHAIADEMLQLGAAVYIVARNKDEVNQCISSWQQQGFAALGSAADVSHSGDRMRLLENLRSHFPASKEYQSWLALDR